MAVVSLTDAHDDNTYVAGNYFGPFAYCSYIQLSSAMILTRARTFGQLSTEFKSQILRLEKKAQSQNASIPGAGLPGRQAWTRRRLPINNWRQQFRINAAFTGSSCWRGRWRHSLSGACCMLSLADLAFRIVNVSDIKNFVRLA